MTGVGRSEKVPEAPSLINVIRVANPDISNQALIATRIISD